MTKRLITKTGFENLKAELEELRSKRTEIVERIKTAKELGDLRENAEYNEARESQAFNEARIFELEELIKGLEVVEDNSNGDKIGVGSKITVKSNGKTQEFELVGPSEANPLGGKISVESPLGSAFLNHKVGDEVTVQAPKGEIKYTIISL